MEIEGIPEIAGKEHYCQALELVCIHIESAGIRKVQVYYKERASKDRNSR